MSSTWYPIIDSENVQDVPLALKNARKEFMR